MKSSFIRSVSLIRTGCFIAIGLVCQQFSLGHPFLKGAHLSRRVSASAVRQTPSVADKTQAAALTAEEKAQVTTLYLRAITAIFQSPSLQSTQKLALVNLLSTLVTTEGLSSKAGFEKTIQILTLAANEPESLLGAKPDTLFIPGGPARSFGESISRGFTSSFPFSTFGESKAPDEPDHCGVIGGASYWSVLTNKTDGVLWLTTEGSDFDTVLAVYTGPERPDFGQLQLLGCDNNSGSDSKTSRVFVRVIKDQIYYVAIDGVNGATGRGVLTYSHIIEPVITSQPASSAITEGETVGFSIQAEGEPDRTLGIPPLSYQWRFNGAGITGATQSTLTITNVQAQQAGRYSVVVTNLAGAVTSQEAVLTISQKSPRENLDSDRTPDIIFQSLDGSLAAWVMAGSEMKAARFLDPPHVGDKGWRLFATADLNVDGKSDLLFQHQDGTLAVWFMDGLQMTVASLLNPQHPGDRNWRATALGDFDRNNKPDLVFQHTDGTLAVWLLDETKMIAATLFNPPHPGNANWRVVGTGDFDLNGKVDLAFQHTDGTLAVWHLDGIRLVSASLMSPARPGDTDWRVVSTADRNGDGKPDLLFQHDDGTLAVWFMDGVKLGEAKLLKPANPGLAWRVLGR